MNIIAFHGSPRKSGNTELLLKEAIRGTGQEVRVFRLEGAKLAPCKNCGGCDKTGVCVVKDDFDEMYKAIREADRIILASPIFFMSLSAQSKILIDRCQSFWCEKYLLNKTVPAGPYGRKGLLLMAGGMKKEAGMKCAETVATAFFRTVGVPEHKTLSYMGVDAKGDIEKHPTALSDAFKAGAELAGQGA